jgi:NAD(P)-dependent dehydrogenase (short-subunit alcohol dehydrogenase family)
MTASLHGKVAIVTGVSHDGQVGQAVAKALAAQGASLAVAARTKDNVVARAAELRADGANVIPVAGSLTDEGDVKRLVAETVGAFGRIDIVVNLAGGLTVYKSSAEVTLDEWTREVNNNVLSAFLLTREVFPHLAKAGGGSVINFARAGNAQANMLPYNVAKAGVVARQRGGAGAGRYRLQRQYDEAQGHEQMGEARRDRRRRRVSCFTCLARCHGAGDQRHRVGSRLSNCATRDERSFACGYCHAS